MDPLTGLFDISTTEVFVFFLVLVRCSIVLTLFPFFGDKTIPQLVKILFSFVIAIAFYPLLKKSHAFDLVLNDAWIASPVGILTQVCLEAIFAFALSFIAKTIFDALNFGSYLIGSFMGFGSAATFDNHQESYASIVSQFQMVFIMLLFLSLGGHSMLIQALYKSYEIVGIGCMRINQDVNNIFISLGGFVIAFAFQVSAPVSLSVFLVNVTFGVMAKTMPQLNIYSISSIVTTLIGIMLLIVDAPELEPIVSFVIEQMQMHMFEFFKTALL